MWASSSPPAGASSEMQPAPHTPASSRALVSLTPHAHTPLALLCRSDESKAFATALAEAYRSVKALGSSFEVVLVSSDRNVDDFARFLGARRFPWEVLLSFGSRTHCSSHSHRVRLQPAGSGPGWLALPFADSLKTREAALSSQYLVRGVPSLVMLAPDGSLINRAAKDRISSPERFPWLPPTVEEALGDVFLNHYGDRVRLRSSLLGGSHVALFFASPSLGACKVFAPVLAEAAARARAGGAGLEVIYVPAGQGDDCDPGSAREAVSRLVGPAAPWLTIPADANPSQRVSQLKTLFCVGDPGAPPPVLVLLDSTLSVVNPDAVRSVTAGERFPWRPRLVWDADDKSSWLGDPGAVGAATLMVLAERAPNSWDACEDALRDVADEMAGTGGSGGSSAPPLMVRSKMCFMISKETHGLGRAVRRLARLPEANAVPCAVLLDLSDNGSFYVMPPGSDPTKAGALRTFIAAYQARALPRDSAGPVPTITVAAALSNPSAAELFGGADDVSPLEACVQCILCPITCPLLCCFRCCMGCCMLTFLGGAIAAGGMGNANTSPYATRYA